MKITTISTQDFEGEFLDVVNTNSFPHQFAYFRERLQDQTAQAALC